MSIEGRKIVLTAKLPAAPRPLRPQSPKPLRTWRRGVCKARVPQFWYVSVHASAFSLHNPWLKRSPVLAPIHLLTLDEERFTVGP